MLSRVVVAVSLLATWPSSAAAESAPESGQAAPPPAHTVQVDPLTTALGFVHVQFERRLAPSFSLYVGPHLRLFRGITTEDDTDNRGEGVEVGARWFFLGPTAPAGAWAQVRGVVARVHQGDEVDVGGYVSALAGYTWIVGDRWVLAAGLGVQYLHYVAGDIGIEGVLPAAHTTFGVAF